MSLRTPGAGLRCSLQQSRWLAASRAVEIVHSKEEFRSTFLRVLTGVDPCRGRSKSPEWCWGPEEQSGRLWNNAANRFGWQSYTGHPPGSVGVDGLAAPSRYDDISGLPPAWIGVGTLDLFFQEGLAYASRLRGADVECELDIVEGAFHGFDYIRPKAAVSRAFRSSQVKALAAALTCPPFAGDDRPGQ
ncbi:MAG: alpha/beta hydrolase fold domain-containing protein [Acidimicrobiales bacterium]